MGLLLLASLCAGLAADGERAQVLNQRTPAYVEFSDPQYTVAENLTNAVITVIRTGEFREEVGVQYATANGTARAGEDYTPQAGTLVIPAGVGVVRFEIPVLEDEAVEGPETVELVLRSDDDNVVITRKTAVLTIEDASEQILEQKLTLSVAQLGDGRIVLSWPATCSGCVLEKSAAPGKAVWTSVRVATRVRGGRCSVVEAASEDVHVYRLRSGGHEEGQLD